MQITSFPNGRQDARLIKVELPELSQYRTLLGTYTLLKVLPIRLPDGRETVGTLWSTPARKSGRRIQVRDQGGAGLFDTNDCYDIANAVNALDLWLRDRVASPDELLDGEAWAALERGVSESHAVANGVRRRWAEDSNVAKNVAAGYAN